MSNKFNIHKIVSALPSTLEPNTIYAVRVGEGFDLYISDLTGSIAHKVNTFQNRTNHTGTQSISTIDGLQTALEGKQPTGDYATNTALTSGLATKENTITAGTTAQYWRGDKTWQTLNSASVGLGNVNNTSDLSKPISTATQTALDLKANLASPTFTDNLTLPNNTRINGIEHFYQSTKPTVRRDGSALVIGDRWWKTDTTDEWFWNGTYWLSSNLQQGSSTFLSNLTGITTQTVPFGVISTLPVFIERVRSYFYIPSGNLSSTNYHVLRLYNSNTALYDLLIQSGDNGITAFGVSKVSTFLGIYIASNHSLGTGYRFDAGNGTPPNTNAPPLATVFYRYVQP